MAAPPPPPPPPPPHTHTHTPSQHYVRLSQPLTYSHCTAPGWGGERRCESEGSCPRTQHHEDLTNRCSNRGHSESLSMRTSQQESLSMRTSQQVDSNFCAGFDFCDFFHDPQNKRSHRNKFAPILPRTRTKDPIGTSHHTLRRMKQYLHRLKEHLYLENKTSFHSTALSTVIYCFPCLYFQKVSANSVTVHVLFFVYFVAQLTGNLKKVTPFRKYNSKSYKSR